MRTTYFFGLPKKIAAFVFTCIIFGILLGVVGVVNKIQLIESISYGLISVGIILLAIFKQIFSEHQSSVNL